MTIPGLLDEELPCYRQQSVETVDELAGRNAGG